MARLLVQTTLPHSRREELSFVRSNGRLHVSVTAHPLLGLPYGRYPRLLLAWVTTEAVRTKSRHLELGPSLSRFLVGLGLTPSGGPNGPIGRLRDQMQRLFGATIAFTWDGESEGQWHDAGFRVARETHLWWEPQAPDHLPAWRSTVSLSSGFYEAITSARAGRPGRVGGEVGGVWAGAGGSFDGGSKRGTCAFPRPLSGRQELRRGLSTEGRVGERAAAADPRTIC